MDERLNELRAALEEDPSSRLFYQLGELLRRDGGYHEAVRVLRAGVGRHPRYVAAWVALGRCHAALDQHEAAEEAFARALEIDPENTVAAWGIGDSAARRGDWERSVKALKLVRALSPRDDRLETAIEEAEAHLAELGPPEPPIPPAPAGAGLTTIPAARIELPRPQLVELSEGDPFELSRRGDTGVWLLGEDVFELPPPEPAPPHWELGEEGRGEVEAEPEAAPEGESAGWELDESAVAPHVERGGEEPAGEDAWQLDETGETTPAAAEAAPDDETSGWEMDEPTPPGGTAAPWEAPEDAPPFEAVEVELPEAVELTEELAGLEAVGPVDDPGWDRPEPAEEDLTPETPWEPVEEIPLPTLTLARLAYAQGDLVLAERTLLGVLRRQPDSGDARSLLEQVRRELGGEGEAVAPAAPFDLATAKVAALRGWMEAIRLAAEQNRP
jgi:tetratricopeptide (TPR) repeat protein